jgi:hypothetical protein
MTKIKTEDLEIFKSDPGYFGRKMRYRVNIDFNARDESFSIDLPANILEKLNRGQWGRPTSIAAKSLDGVRKAWVAAMESLVTGEEKRRKVITLNWSDNVLLIKDGKTIYNSLQECYRWDSDGQASLRLDYVVREEVDFMGNKTYMDYKKGEYHSIGRDAVVIDWTQEREDFLKETCNLMGLMAYRAKQFFKDEKTVTKNIDSGIRLLPAAKDGET